MRLALSRTSDRSAPPPSRVQRRRWKPGFDPLESKALLSFTVVNLGDLGGGFSEAMAINNLGQVVGVSKTSGGEDHAFLYSNGQMADLGTLPGTSGSFATGINGSAQVVGYCTLSNDAHQAFLYSAHTGMIDLGTLPGYVDSVASGINDSGQVVGFCTSSLGAQEAFLYSGGEMSALSVPAGYADGGAQAINESGEVVGSAVLTGGGDAHAVLWSGDNMSDLGTLPGDLYSFSSGINDSGQVVGASSATLTSPRHAFLYSAQTGMIDLPTPLNGPEPSSEAWGINDSGQVVGDYTQVNGLPGEGFLYQNGVVIGISNPVSPGASGGLALGSARAINDHGQIVGYAMNSVLEQPQAYLIDLMGQGSAQPPQVTEVVSASQDKKGLIGITVIFDEPLDANVVNDRALFNVRGAVKQHHRTVFTKAVRIKGISFDGQTRVTINLAKPYKGAVQVTVLAGILAADGASSTTDYSAVVD